jgi:hypothetical protein
MNLGQRGDGRDAGGTGLAQVAGSFSGNGCPLKSPKNLSECTEDGRMIRGLGSTLHSCSGVSGLVNPLRLRSFSVSNPLRFWEWLSDATRVMWSTASDRRARAPKICHPRSARSKFSSRFKLKFSPGTALVRLWPCPAPGTTWSRGARRGLSEAAASSAGLLLSGRDSSVSRGARLGLGLILSREALPHERGMPDGNSKIRNRPVMTRGA